MTLRSQQPRFCLGRHLAVLVLGAFVLFPAAASAEEQPAPRPAVITRCVACHGAFGINDNEAWPDLAGLPAGYFAKQLRDYRSGQRKDPWMSQMAIPLSDAEIDALAAYFSELAGVHGAAESPPDAAQSCLACHSTRAVATNPLWPGLSGQNPRYLAKQLRDYQAGRRADPVMVPLAKALSEQQIVKLADYFGRQ